MMGIAKAFRDVGTSLPFGIGYATGTKIGFEGLGEWIFPSSNKTYNTKQPTNFRLPYYRYRRYSRRYGRYRRPRFRRFRRSRYGRYRTRRFY